MPEEALVFFIRSIASLTMSARSACRRGRQCFAPFFVSFFMRPRHGVSLTDSREARGWRAKRIIVHLN